MESYQITHLERNVKPPIIMFHVNIFRGVVTPATTYHEPHMTNQSKQLVRERDLSLHQKRQAFRLDMSVQRVTGGHRSSPYGLVKKNTLRIKGLNGKGPQNHYNHGCFIPRFGSFRNYP